jgi:type VI secretion system secreted protein VgrG
MTASVQFRPRRVTPKPRVNSVITGFIYAESLQDTLPLDGQGRYRVQLPFVNADDPGKRVTCWMRMAQPSAGPRFGTVYTLEVGAEVLVQFINGDPDRPVIWGSMYNGATDLLRTSEGAFV